MSYIKDSNRKRKKIEGDTYTIATFDLPFETDKTTLTNKLLNKGYKLYFRNGIKTLVKGDDVIKIGTQPVKNEEKKDGNN